MKPLNVDDYLASTPKEMRGKLDQLRKAIKEVAPQAQEKLSYGIPYYGYYGRLAYFRLQKNHIGLYIPPPVIKDHIKELKDYETVTSTVRFPLDKKLPIPLVKKLVKARMKLNEEAKQKKPR